MSTTEKNTTAKKSFNVKDIAIVVLVIALIISLVCSLVSLGNARADANAKSEELQAQLNNLKDQLGGKLDAEDAVSWDKVKEEIQNGLEDVELPAGVTKDDVTTAITEAINAYKGQDITSDAIQSMIDSAIAKIEIAGGLDTEAVEKLIKDAIDKITHPEGLDKATVQKMIKDAIAGIQFPETLDQATVEKLINDAIAGIKFPESVDRATVEQIVKDAIAGIQFPESVDRATVEQLIKDAIANIEFPESIDRATVEQLIKEAVDALRAEFDSCVTKDEMDAAITEAIKNLPEILTEEQVKDIVNGILESFKCPCDHMTKEELEELIKDIIESMGGDVPSGVMYVGNVHEWNFALSEANIVTVILTEDIVLDEVAVIDRGLVIDLNGKTVKAPTNVEYPNAMIFTVEEGSTLTIKNGTIVDNAARVNGGMDFIRIDDGATLNLDNVSIAITLTPYVYYNNTMDRWQTNSATHRIFVIGTEAVLNMNDSNVTVVSPKTQNVSKYVRYRFSIVGVHFAQNGQNAQFVMDGGSFSIQVTDPNAVKSTYDYTDTLYFVKAERVTDSTANATNTVTLKGDAKVTVGGPDEAGKLQTTNNLFYLGAGYSGGKTYYSGIKTVTVAPGVEFDLNGVLYSMNTTAKWDLESLCQALGSNFANNRFENIEEIKYHFVCSNKGYTCTHEADYTLAELPTKCPVCGKGKLTIK